MKPTDGDIVSSTAAQRIYDMAPCGYSTVLWDGAFVDVNETFLRWTGFEREEIIGVRSFADLLNPAGQIYNQTHLRPMLLMSGTLREIALELECSDGTRLPVLINASLERDGDNEPHLIRMAIFDASERRAYEQELLRAKERAEASEKRARLLARTLQQTLIPPSPPNISGLEVAAVYRPAGSGEEVGGDFYDIFQRRAGEWVVVLGDVCGKGVDAAVVTALVRYSLRATAVDYESPSAAMQVLNRIVLDHETDRFCTVVLMYLRRTQFGWEVRVCAAGHPAPVVVGREAAAALDVAPSPLVGVLDTPTFVDAEHALAPGQMLLLYTDGVTEGRCDGQFFGETRMFESINSHRDSAKNAADGLLASVVDFQFGLTRDDIAIVALRVPNERPHKSSHSAHP